jgi:hypothetical protein
MRTATQYLSRFPCVAPLQSKMRNGMEEVVGSNPTRSTKSPSDLDGASACNWLAYSSLAGMLTEIPRSEKAKANDNSL